MVLSDGERKYSEETAREIDVEVRKIIDDATHEVRSILVSRSAALEAVARTLVEREVIDGSELRTLLDAHDPGPKLVPGSLPREARPASPEGEISERNEWKAAGGKEL
jgi:cell division protease FtsH